MNIFYIGHAGYFRLFAEYFIVSSRKNCSLPIDAFLCDAKNTLKNADLYGFLDLMKMNSTFNCAQRLTVLAVMGGVAAPLPETEAAYAAFISVIEKTG